VSVSRPSPPMKSPGPRKTLLEPQFGGERLVAGAAVDEVPLHGVALLGDGVIADRREDLRVLMLKQIELFSLCRRRRASPDRAPRDDERAEIFEETAELRITGGIGDLAVKGEVLIDRVIASGDGCLDRRTAVGDLFHLCR
jgi:hypothetical protein